MYYSFSSFSVLCFIQWHSNMINILSWYHLLISYYWFLLPFLFLIINYIIKDFCHWREWKWWLQLELFDLWFGLAWCLSSCYVLGWRFRGNLPVFLSSSISRHLLVCQKNTDLTCLLFLLLMTFPHRIILIIPFCLETLLEALVFSADWKRWGKGSGACSQGPDLNGF